MTFSSSGNSLLVFIPPWLWAWLLTATCLESRHAANDVFILWFRGGVIAHGPLACVLLFCLYMHEYVITLHLYISYTYFHVYLNTQSNIYFTNVKKYIHTSSSKHRSTWLSPHACRASHCYHCRCHSNASHFLRESICQSALSGWPN